MAVSKTVANWMLVGRTVVTAIRHFGPDFAGKLEEELFPDGPPEHLTMEKVLAALADALDRRLAAVSDADQALAAERADDDGFREARDEAWTALRSLVMGSRASVEGGYGADAAVRVGLDGPLPDNADQLVGQARTVAKLLTPANLGEPGPVPGASIDPATLAAAFRAGADTLDGALTDVRSDQRENQDALNARDTALSALSSGYRGAANIMVGVAFLVGRPDVADRVRPTATRRMGRPDPQDVGNAASGGSGTGAGGDASGGASGGDAGGGPAPG